MSYTPIPKKKVVFVDASSDTTVAAGTNETITIQPPQGKIYRILGIDLYASAPAGATTGTHQFDIFTEDLFVCGFYGRSNYSDPLEFRNFAWISATATKMPSITTYEQILRQLRASATYPLGIVYRNGTDADQNSTRLIKLLIEEEDEAQ